MSLSRSRLVGTHWRHAPGATLVVALIVMLLTIAITVLPHVLSSIREDTLSEHLDEISVTNRDLVVKTRDVGPPSAGTGERLPAEFRSAWAGVEDRLQAIRADAPTHLRAAMEDPNYVAIAGNIDESMDGRVFIAMDPFYDTHFELVEGRLPETVPTKGATTEFEIIAPRATAEAFDWQLNETREIPLGQTMTIDENGEIVQSPLPRFTLVGIYQPDDVRSSYWSQLAPLTGPTTYYDPYGQPSVTGYFFTNPASVMQARQWAPLPTTYWFPIDSAQISESTVPVLQGEIETFIAQSHTLSEWDPGGARFQTQLGRVLDRVSDTNHAFTALALIFVAGPIGVGVAVLVLGSRMISQHRRSAFALMDARGASPLQRRLLMAGEGLIAAVPAAIIGVAIGASLVLTIFTRSSVPLFSALTIALLVGVALFPAVALAASAPGAERAARVDDAKPAHARVFVEMAVVILTVAATIAFTSRGAGTAETGVDPLATLTPLLLTVTAALITLRLYPLVLRAVHARLRAGNGFIDFIGSARAVREASAGAAALLALLVGVSIAVSSTVVLSTIDTSAQRMAEIRAGADLTLSVPRFADDAAERVAALDGVNEVVPVRNVPNVAVVVDNRTTRVPIYAFDSEAFERISPHADALIPDGNSLRADGSVPVIVSQSASERLGITLGDLTIGGTQEKVTANVIAVVEDTTGFAAMDIWILVDDEYLDDIVPAASTVSTLLVDLDDGVDPATVVEAVKREVEPFVSWITPESALAETTSGSTTAGLRGTLFTAIGLTALLCAIAIVLTLVLNAPARARLLALLKTLGAPPRSGGGIVSWELVPLCIAAVAAGTAFGLTLPLLLFQVLDLRSFSGADNAPAYSVDPLLLTISLGGFLAVAALFTLLSLFFARRVKVSSVLRTVEES
ncbi:FtsX-like permease family protein [Microbacterium sp. YY-03]|uniref:ABC transporter permease n=1 Tax=Microbacterium sp. YY-03 TaxID=3421636 RepID=UPI003D1672A7